MTKTSYYLIYIFIFIGVAGIVSSIALQPNIETINSIVAGTVYIYFLIMILSRIISRLKNKESNEKKHEKEFLLGNIDYYEKFTEKVLQEENDLLRKLNAGAEYYIEEKNEKRIKYDKKAKSIPYKIMKNIFKINYQIILELKGDRVLITSPPLPMDNIKKLWVKMFLESDLPFEDNLFLIDILELIGELKTQESFSKITKEYINNLNYKQVISQKIDARIGK